MKSKEFIKEEKMWPLLERVFKLFKYEPAIKSRGKLFVKGTNAIMIGSASRLKNDAVWRSKP
jgi:hypothetical protein